MIHGEGAPGRARGIVGIGRSAAHHAAGERMTDEDVEGDPCARLQVSRHVSLKPHKSPAATTETGHADASSPARRLDRGAARSRHELRPARIRAGDQEAGPRDRRFSGRRRHRRHRPHPRGRAGPYAPTVLVENKPGAAARIAVEYVKNAEPDGSVRLFTPDFPITVYPHSFRSLSYDPLRDFTAVSPAARSML